jgi:hypothetical protein
MAIWKTVGASAVLFLLLVLVCVFSVPFVKSQSGATLSYGLIHIAADGNVTGTDQLVREGNVYRLTDNLNAQFLVIECSNIILDGGGFTLQGTSIWDTPPAINLTCSNVTVQNFNIKSYETGILGAYNGNTVKDNNLTGSERNLAIYADNYTVTGNHVEGGLYGVRVGQARNVDITRNQIDNSAILFWISNSTGVRIAANVVRGSEKIVFDMDNSDLKVYLNNFEIDNANNPIVLSSHLWGATENNTVQAPWDNGVVGNYWKDYAAKYPNATGGAAGVGSIPYVVNVFPNVTDRYPLIAPVETQSVVLSAFSLALPATPKPTQTPQSTPTPASPTQTPTQTPQTTEHPTATVPPTASPTPEPTPPSYLSENAPTVAATAAAIIITFAAVLILRRRIRNRPQEEP